MAKNLGFPDYESAQSAPVALIGKPSEVREELEKRIKETGVTYYIMLTASPETQDMFVSDVMPHFT